MITSDIFSRDLDWLISCPSLLDLPVAMDTASLEIVKTLPDFSPVQEFLKSPASYRVGYYVESLVEVWLRSLTGIGSLEHSLQINGTERTLGELDFLYRLDGIVKHLEVALKFYLYNPNDDCSGSYFAGPNARDTFEKKRDKLLKFQLPLGREQFPEIEISQVMMKGMIFYPPGVDQPENLPEGMNPKHRSGIWIRESDCDWLSAESGFACGMILEKPYWLSGITSGSEQQIQPIDELRATVGKHFKNKRHPLFVSLGDAKGIETVRVFVVSDSWPDQDPAQIAART